MNNIITKTKLGNFDITSGSVIISDPCYTKETWCNGKIDSIKNGQWKAKVIKSGEGDNRCAILLAYHKDHKVDYNDKDFKSEDITVGVDSGQAGIFDEKYFKDDTIVEGVERIDNNGAICEDEPWYSICCDRTLSKQGAGVIPYGCVSSSGYGDGCYDCFSRKVNGKIVGIMIDFGVLE